MGLNNAQKGYFITLEGVEGVGKTTQLEAIVSFLNSKLDQPVLVTREPGGTGYAEKIREILLLKPQDFDIEEIMAPETELLLLFASRAQHIHSKILPALNKGQWVVCSRFTDSSFAYSGGGRGFSLDKIEKLAEWVHPDFSPDLTLLLDMPVKIGLERAKNRAELDRIEMENLDFFERVRSVYLNLAEKYSTRFRVINASEKIESVTEVIQTHLSNFLQEVSSQ